MIIGVRIVTSFRRENNYVGTQERFLESWQSSRVQGKSLYLDWGDNYMSMIS